MSYDNPPVVQNLEHKHHVEHHRHHEKQQDLSRSYGPNSSADNHLVAQHRGTASHDAMHQFGQLHLVDDTHKTTKEVKGQKHLPDNTHFGNDQTFSHKTTKTETRTSEKVDASPTVESDVAKAEKDFKEGQKTHDYTKLVHDLDQAKATWDDGKFKDFKEQLDQKMHKDGLAANLTINSLGDGMINIEDSYTGGVQLGNTRFDKYTDPVARGGLETASGETRDEAHGKFQAYQTMWKNATHSTD